ncbi:MAG: response regulator transcription factor [Clostridia bacterium]|nr:response regulator transcription factor [Clostridia bacterium]MBR5742847.1 response regulator transcription factor [Clostridia bacterium]
MIRILIVEDEKPIARLIEWNLTDAGYQTAVCHNGLEAADLLTEKSFDLILLDIMLPGLDGYELLESIKPGGTPVIFLTAKGSVEDRVAGLRAGADDYLTKPFEIAELLARVESVLRRTGREEDRYEIGDVVILPRSMQVTRAGQKVILTQKEFDLLMLFVRNRNVALYRDTIYERVWEGEMESESRTVDLHVQRLRKKLGWQKKLVTIYKVGYRLEG